MTIIIAFLLGTGALLILSAIENQPIVATFQKIIKGEKLDLTGKAQSTQQPTTPQVGSA